MMIPQIPLGLALIQMKKMGIFPRLLVSTELGPEEDLGRPRELRVSREVDHGSPQVEPSTHHPDINTQRGGLDTRQEEENTNLDLTAQEGELSTHGRRLGVVR